MNSKIQFFGDTSFIFMVMGCFLERIQVEVLYTKVHQRSNFRFCIPNFPNISIQRLSLTFLCLPPSKIKMVPLPLLMLWYIINRGRLSIFTSLKVSISFRPEFVVTWLGLAKIGIIPAFINYNLKKDALLHTINVADCRAIIYGLELENGM